MMKHIISSVTITGLLAISAQVPGRAEPGQAQVLSTTGGSPGTNADSPPRITTFVRTQIRSDAGDPFAADPASGQRKIVIQSIDSGDDRGSAREVAWLGLGVAESPEVLSSQLGLKPGEGLTVSYLSPGSPAAQANFRRNDVLVELDGQMLVDPEQFRKLVQMHAAGETIKLTYFRGGQKQTAEVKLGQRAAELELDHGAGPARRGLPDYQLKLDDLNGEFHDLQDSLARAGLDKAKLKIELDHTLAQTRKAIQDSLQNASGPGSLTNLKAALDALARNGLNVDSNATVIVRSGNNSSRTLVNTDENGSIIYLEGEKKHLTAHDQAGKLLFDGDIDTPAEQAKVPPAVWEKYQQMLQQNPSRAEGESESSGSSSSASRSPGSAATN